MAPVGPDAATTAAVYAGLRGQDLMDDHARALQARLDACLSANMWQCTAGVGPAGGANAHSCGSLT
jgi:hypothetical protein